MACPEHPTPVAVPCCGNQFYYVHVCHQNQLLFTDVIYYYGLARSGALVPTLTACPRKVFIAILVLDFPSNHPLPDLPGIIPQDAGGSLPQLHRLQGLTLLSPPGSISLPPPAPLSVSNPTASKQPRGCGVVPQSNLIWAARRALSAPVGCLGFVISLVCLYIF